MKYRYSLLLICLVLVIFSCSESSVKSIDIQPNRSALELRSKILNDLPFEDKSDFERAEEGFISTLSDPKIYNDDGTIGMDLSWFNFLDQEAPSTVNPSLWRQSQLNRKHGLFKVTEGIYQVRGFDLANMTVVATDEGWIVIDPLTTVGVAKAAMKLVDDQLGKKPVKAIIITHSHIDHFGGMKGIANEAEISEKGIEIIAPEGFFEHSISENVIGGNGMKRRATYMFGHLLPTDSLGMIGNGLGQKVSSGKVSILKPTITITETGQTINIDGLDIIFQNTPEAEAPAECMFYFPKYKAFCQAEEINHTLHNLYTLRGAQVRNGLKWSKYIDQTIQLFGDEVEVSFGSHHWPTWGREEILELWEKQRDLYKFVHDETLHRANQGYTMLEIAEMVKLPNSLSSVFANRGYYGTLSHNVKAQYQLYYGWFDANPANLHALPPEAESKKYIEYMGGSQNVLELVQSDIDKGNLRWAATMLNHIVFAEPKNQTARNKLAEVYTNLGIVSESGPWRNFYLTGAQELREGITQKHFKGLTSTDDILVNLTLENFYDYMAVRLDRSKINGKEYVFNMVFPDIDQTISLYLKNDVLHNRPGVFAENANATITMNKSVFNDIITKKTTGLRKVLSGDIKIEGKRSDYTDFQKLMETPFEEMFNIIEP